MSYFEIAKKVMNMLEHLNGYCQKMKISPKSSILHDIKNKTYEDIN